MKGDKGALARRAPPRTARLAGAMAAALALSACAAQVRNHGYVPTDADLEEIVVGVDDKASVESTIGTPSVAGVLNEDGYFYVSQQVRAYGWREPVVIDREIVAISFDSRGVVSNIERFGLEDGNVVALSRRVTDSNVQGITFLRQLLGNLGRLAPGFGNGGAPDGF